MKRTAAILIVAGAVSTLALLLYAQRRDSAGRTGPEQPPLAKTAAEKRILGELEQIRERARCSWKSQSPTAACCA